MPPIIREDFCSGCGRCAEICPSDVFLGSKNGEIPIVRYAEECWHCYACVLECPADAIYVRLPLPMMVVYK